MEPEPTVCWGTALREIYSIQLVQGGLHDTLHRGHPPGTKGRANWGGQRANLRVQNRNEQYSYLHWLVANIRSESMCMNTPSAEPGSYDNVSFLVSRMRDLSDFRAEVQQGGGGRKSQHVMGRECS